MSSPSNDRETNQSSSNPPATPLIDDAPPPPPPPIPAPGSVEASYFEKLLLYIPADIIGAYLAVDGILKQSLAEVTIWTYWAVFVAMLVLTPLYVWVKPSETTLMVLKCSPSFRIVTSTIAFCVWIFALGGPFAATFAWYHPVYGSLLLIITTLAIPVFEKMAARFNI